MTPSWTDFNDAESQNVIPKGTIAKVRLTIRPGGYNDEQRASIIGSFCPNTLYPFAREAIADLIQKGGFPQLLLQPINFDALYTQAQQERADPSLSMTNPPTGDGETH